MPIANNQKQFSLFPPNHLINYSCITLDKFNNLGGNVLIHVGGNREPMVTIITHLYGYINGLQEVVLVDSCKDKNNSLGCASVAVDGDYGAGLHGIEDTLFGFKSRTENIPTFV